MNLSGADLSGADLSESLGLPYSQVAFTNHGERGRTLTLVCLAGEQRFFCGCFQGTPRELAEYIEKGEDRFKKSRTATMNFCLESLTMEPQQ